MTSALSYFPTTAQIRSCVSLKDKVSMVGDLFLLFLCYPLYHVPQLRGLASAFYKLMKDYRFRAGGITFVLPGNCPPENTYINENYEPEVRSIIESFRDGVFVDAGAGIGLYTLIAAKNGNKVVALEPDLNLFTRLMKAILAEDLPGKVLALPMAAWSHAGRKPLFNHPFARFSSSLKEGSIPSLYSENSSEVLTIQLDSIEYDGSPLLMKLDIEGSEPEAMTGALKTLLRKDVTVIFEALSQDALQRSKRVIEPLGYKVTQLSERDYLARR